MEAVRWVLNLLQKNSLFANLKKFCFHQDKVHFLGDIMLAQGVQIKDKRIEAVIN